MNATENDKVAYWIEKKLDNKLWYHIMKNSIDGKYDISQTYNVLHDRQTR